MINGLTIQEHKEFQSLKKLLFKGDIFVEFEHNVLESVEYKRYDHLIDKKLQHLKELHEYGE